MRRIVAELLAPRICGDTIMDQDRGEHGPGWIFDSIEYHLHSRRDTASARAYARDRHRLFTPAQFGAIARFAEYYGCPVEDRQHWLALAAGGAWHDPE